MEWFALLIPVVLIAIGILLFRHNLVWWEIPLPVIVTALIVLACKAGVKTQLVKDKEYWGSMVVEARYYEYYEYWVEQTCSYTTTCCCDSKGDNCQTTTHYYDCSYCSHHDARWEAVDDAGHHFNISEDYYKYLIGKWNAKPEFVELNRDIDYHGSCGKDGDMYRIKWDGRIESSEAAVTIHDYTNKVQASHSAFKLPYISEKQADSTGLYKYPEPYGFYKQRVVLGLEKLVSKDELWRIETKFQYFNGHYGNLNKVKLFILLFYDKPISISYKQEAFWDGGNQNELVICIGLNGQSRNIDWVRPFSWTDRKRTLVDCREDINELGRFDADQIYTAIEKSIQKNVMYKDFQKDFSYLEVDLPRWSIWLICILSFIFSLATIAFCIGNEIDCMDDIPNQYPKVKSKMELGWLNLITAARAKIELLKSKLGI